MIRKVSLAVVYFLVATPIGLAVRLVRDPLRRQRVPNARSYWTLTNHQ